MNIFTPKGFLTWGGIILVLVAILGFVGLIGPTAEQSIFGGAWWFDNAENWAHLVLGAAALILAYTTRGDTQRWIVLVLGIIGVLVAVYNLFSTQLFGANLESPMDLLLHLVVGVWALWAGWAKKGAAAKRR